MALPMSMLVVMGLVAAAFVPLLGAHLVQLWARPHYQFFPLVFVGAGMLAYMRFPGLALLRPGSAAVSWCLLGVSWLLLAAAEALNSSYLAMPAFLVLLLAAIWAAGGAMLLRRLLPAWLFLWLLIPPPFGLDNQLVLALQGLTTQWSSALLDQFGVFHVVAGNVVEVGTRRLFVAEACAGINSLFSILACAIFYVLFMRTGPIRSVLLILASVCWVLLANVLRVFLVAYLARRSGIDVAEGWRHEALGYGLFAAALVLIWSTDRMLLFLTPARWRPSPAPATEAPAVADEQPAVAQAGLRGSWLNSWLAAGAFGLLLVGHVTLNTFAGDGQPALAGNALHIAALDKDSLPQKLDGWQSDKFYAETRNPGSAFGEFSRTWSYRGDGQAGTVSLDFPFPGWHEWPECYRNQGWEVEEKADRTGTGERQPAHYSERTLKKAGMRHAQLFFCEFDCAGQVLEPERGGVGATVRRHESALGRLLGWNQPSAATQRIAPPVYQFQLLVEGDAPLTTAEGAAARNCFFTAYAVMREKLLP
jgi:exosortase